MRRPRLDWHALLELARRESALIVLLLIISGLLLGFGSLAEEVLEGDTAKLDEHIIGLFRNPADPSQPLGPAWLLEAMRDLTSLGSTLFLALVFLLVLVYFLIARKKAAALLFAVAVLGGQGVSTILKLLIDRPRPPLPDWAPRVVTASFPSGHSMLSAVTFLTIGALLSRVEPRPALRVYFVSVAVLLTVLVGASRVYLGVHWPTDVLAGWALGSAWALICWTAALWLQRRGKVEQPG
jgi:undecaprenyl-diphosphatase